jgi:hypothetical protein
LYTDSFTCHHTILFVFFYKKTHYSLSVDL